MQDLNDKITGSTLTATEWNEVPSELQNVIENLGLTLSSGDLNQLGKAIAGYVANGTFYTDSGVADAYVLAVVGGKQNAPAYTNGFEINFVTVNTNTGASTVNVAGLGVKNIKLAGGADPAAGDITGRTKCVFDSGNDWFELILVADDASDVSYDNSTSGLTATDVQAAIDEVAEGAIGVGQTWQNVSGSRSAGVVYTNTTGRSILVNITVNPNTSQGLFKVDGIDVAAHQGVNTTTERQNLTAIVPDGSTYQLTAAGDDVTIWAELR